MLTIVILLRAKCGLSKCITRYLLAMAVADFLVLIFTVVLFELNDTYFPNSVLNRFYICSLKYLLGFVVVDCSVWLTICFTFDRFVAICCEKLRSKYCNEQTASIVIAVVIVLCISENIPIYFAFEPREIMDGVEWHCLLKSSFYAAAGWVAYSWTDNVLTPFAPFILILLLNTLTIRHIMFASKIRKALHSKSGGIPKHDPEVQNRNKSIVLLIAISASFVLLWLTATIYFITAKITDAQHFDTDYSHALGVMEKSGYMLQLLNPCTNTFIYAVSQTKFRLELMHVIEWPFRLIIKALK
ncbi:probable G-protein coupled receptor 139 [Narcine bancroftii]|uniref:probable G-protein coupled receptor 139 n=1 Tax=Narcine bancroftii TaxID=1343680 RepID=UPI003831704D